MSNMENFTIEIDADGIALVTFDVPGRSMNAISASVQRDLDVLVAAIKSDDSIRAMVLQSGKESGFCAGAELGRAHAALHALMRISYAVFFWTKKNTTVIIDNPCCATQITKYGTKTQLKRSQYTHTYTD